MSPSHRFAASVEKRKNDNPRAFEMSRGDKICKKLRNGLITPSRHHVGSRVIFRLTGSGFTFPREKTSETRKKVHYWKRARTPTRGYDASNGGRDSIFDVRLIARSSARLVIFPAGITDRLRIRRSHCLRGTPRVIDMVALRDRISRWISPTSPHFDSSVQMSCRSTRKIAFREPNP